MLWPVAAMLGLYIPVERLAQFSIDSAMGKWDDQGDMIDNKTMNRLSKSIR